VEHAELGTDRGELRAREKVDWCANEIPKGVPTLCKKRRGPVAGVRLSPPGSINRRLGTPREVPHDKNNCRFLVAAQRFALSQTLLGMTI
jgi:hypothetical protein